MKNKRINLKVIIPIIIVSIITVITVVIAVVLVNSGNFEIKSLKVNGISAVISDDTIVANIPQSESVSISTELYDSDVTIKYYNDDAHKNEISDVSKIKTSEQNLIIYITTGKSGTVKQRYTLYINMQPPQEQPKNELLSLSINGIPAEISDSTATIALKRATIYNVTLSVSDDATYYGFYDDAMLNRIDDLSNIDKIVQTESESRIYLNVISKDGRAKIYTIILKFILDDNTVLSSVFVNNVSAHIDGQAIAVIIERCKSLNVQAICASAYTKLAYYSDASCNNLLDEKNIDISDYSNPKYRLYIKATAENGINAIYTLTVNFNPSRDAELLDMKANNSAISFTEKSARLEYEGTPETFVFDIQNIKISDYAAYSIFKDAEYTDKVTDINNIRLDKAEQTLYLAITAEDGSQNLYTINITLISNDNELKMLRINGQENIIKSENCEISIESSNIIDIDTIKTDENAEVTVFYDISQTVPVKDLHNIKYADNRAELYFRIVAENADIKVYHIVIIIKHEPTIDFPVSTVQLEEWQSLIATNDLFSISGNAYTDNQFDVQILWDSKTINTDHISVNNEDKYHELKITISSQYFQAFSASKTIHVKPYTLRAVSAKLTQDTYNINDVNHNFVLSDFITLDSGSYVLGSDFYIEFNNSSNTKLVLSQTSPFNLSAGTYRVFINSFRHDFDTISVGTVHIVLTQKNIPMIYAPDYLEYTVSDDSVILKELFNIIANDYEIILIKTYVNDIESDVLKCVTGTYNVKLQAFYDDGVVEHTIKIQIAALSDNTEIKVYINDEPIAFIDNCAKLPNIPYSGDFEIEVETLSSKATSAVYLNDIATNTDNLVLIDGENKIKIVVTAESGATAEYLITVVKDTKKLPEIIAENTTVRLAKNNYRIDLSDSFIVIENDYVGTLKLFLDGVEIDSTYITVENINSIYTVTIKYEGDFGIITKDFEIGVLRYEEVEIIFANNIINKTDPDYVFTYKDFISEIDYYGIDANNCELKMFCDNAPFSAATLPSGTYYITAQIWLTDTPISEQSAWFTIVHDEQVPSIVVSLKSAEMIITENPSVKTFDDCFEIESEYRKEQLRIVFIYDNEDTTLYQISLKHGENIFTVLITDIVTGEELYRQRYSVKCTYIPFSNAVFKMLYINDAPVIIDGNTVVLRNYNTARPVKIEYELNKNYSIQKMQTEIELHYGINNLYYTAIENTYVFNGLLNIYLVNNITDYISSIYYSNIPAVDNKIILDSNTTFDIENIKIELKEHDHIKTTLSIKSERADVYEILIYGYFDDIAIGYTFVRVFVGSEPPRLIDIINRVSAPDIIFTNLSDYSLTLYMVSNSTEHTVDINFLDSIYNADFQISGLHIGQNDAILTVKDNLSREYEYSVSIYLFPEEFIETVYYNGELLHNVNNRYLCDTSSINPNGISITLREALSQFDLSITDSDLLFNDNIIGIEYAVTFNNIKIYEFSVVVNNGNLAVEVENLDGQALSQTGDSTFNDSITIERSSTATNSVLYVLKTVYAYTVIDGNNLEYIDGIGYFLTLDISEYVSKEQGEYEYTYGFVARALNGDEKTYSLLLSITIFERNEQSAAITITLNNEQRVYILESELNAGMIYVRDAVELGIDCETISVIISNDLGYSIYDQSTAVSNLSVKRKFASGKYIIEFKIGLDELYLKTVNIPIAEFKTSSGTVIETACSINNQIINILKTAETENITYNDKNYDVRIAQEKLVLTENISQVEIKLFGIMLEYGEFVFTDESSGQTGIASIQDGKILIVYKERDLIIPYALIYIEFDLQKDV